MSPRTYNREMMMKDVNVRIIFSRDGSTVVSQAEFVLSAGDGAWQADKNSAADEIARRLFGVSTGLFAYTEGNVRTYQRELPRGWTQLAATAK